MIELPMSFGGQTRMLNLSVILDPDKGHTVVDTGLPGQEELILVQLEAAGIEPSQIKRILLTHQDIDHIGSLKALKEATGAEILALDVEVPYIDGSRPSPKMPPPERLEQMPEFKAMIEGLQRCSVDTALKDGEKLDLAGGVTVVATPGHTFGHLSLYLDRSKSLITGDAMVSESGKLEGPMEMATPDMPTAKESVKKLANLDVETIVCYHGGIVDEDPNTQLQRVAAE